MKLIEMRIDGLGESITEATIIKWHKQAGDTVKKKDTVVELETDKINVEISASYNGTIQSNSSKQEGATVSLGEVLFTIETYDEETTPFTGIEQQYQTEQQEDAHQPSKKLKLALLLCSVVLLLLSLTISAANVVQLPQSVVQLLRYVIIVHE